MSSLRRVELPTQERREELLETRVYNWNIFVDYRYQPNNGNFVCAPCELLRTQNALLLRPGGGCSSEHHLTGMLCWREAATASKKFECGTVRYCS